MNRKRNVISSVSEKSNETNGIPHYVRNDNNQQPTTNNQQQTTNNKKQKTNNQIINL